MYLATQPLCNIIGLKKNEFDILRRVLKPELRVTRRWGEAGRNVMEWDVSDVVKWLDGLIPGGVNEEMQRQIISAAVL